MGTRGAHGETRLKPKHRLFALEYLSNGMNATAAYRAVYPTNKNPDVDGPKLLGTPGVKGFIAKRLGKREGRLDAKAQAVLDELEHVGFARISRVTRDDGSVVPLSEWPEHEKAALTKLEVRERFGKPVATDDGGMMTPLIGRSVKARMDDKLGALNTLAQVHGLVKPKDEGNASMKLEELILLARRTLELELQQKAGGER